MPPKGWRKDSEGNYPATSYVKEQESITIEDLLFPKSSIVAIAKEVAAGGPGQGQETSGRRLVISGDAGLALQRSATVFVNHLLMFARELARDQHRKSCSVEDVLEALDHVGQPALKPLVRDRLRQYQAAVELRRAHNHKETAEEEARTEEQQATAPVEDSKKPRLEQS